MDYAPGIVLYFIYLSGGNWISGKCKNQKRGNQLNCVGHIGIFDSLRACLDPD